MSEWDWKGRGREGLPTLATENCDARDESRQHYANVRIQEMQRSAIELRHEVLPLDFSELLRAFRMFGEDYDNGARLRDDLMDGAA